MNYLEEYYGSYDEEGRLLSRHGQVEYLTTMKYIRESLEGLSGPSVLEVGAGTGRYSVTLAKEGLRVTAVDLVEHNLEILRSKLDGTEPISVIRGNATDLSFLTDGSFDLTLLLGPMYHLYTREDKVRALSEAVRVTRPGGRILVAYCMNEPTVVQYVFGLNNLREVMDLSMLTPDWRCISEPKDLFEMVRTEDIASLDAEIPVRRIRLVATDGATNFMRDRIDEMDDETFGRWMDYHFAVCERQDLVGASHHTLDILEKEDGADDPKAEREWDPRWSELDEFAMVREISVTPFTGEDYLQSFYDFFEIRKDNRGFSPVPTGTDLYGSMADLAGEEAGGAVAAETERLFGLPRRLTRFEDAQELLDEMSGPRGLAPFFFVFDVLFCEYEGFTLCFLCGTNN